MTMNKLFSDRLIPESPRWLLMHGRRERLKELIVYASKTNRVELEEEADEIVKKLIRVSRKIYVEFNVSNKKILLLTTT